jgi:hypothetical protein
MQQQPDADKPVADADLGGASPRQAPTGQSQAERVIAKFGGIRPMAAKLAIAVTTVQGWKERGTIPQRRQAEILAAAHSTGIELTEADFMTESAEASAEEPVAEPVEPANPAASGPWREARSEAPKAPPIIDAPPQPKARAGASRAGLWIVVVLVLAAAAGGAGWWYGQKNAGGVDLGPLERRLAAAEAKLESLPAIEAAAKAAGDRAEAASAALSRLEASMKQQGDRLAALEAKVAAGAGAAAAPADDGAVRAALDDAKKAVADAQAQSERALAALRDDVTKSVVQAKDANAQALADIRAETAKLAAALDAAAKRIGALEAAKAEAVAGGARLAAMVAAIGQLRDSVLAGRPYATELKALQALEDDPAPPPPALAAHAATGVPSIDTLRSHFTRRAAAIVDAASAPEGGDWLDRTWHRLKTIVTVRRTGGELAGNDAEDVVGRAERQLADNDLAGAVATLGALGGAAASEARGWLAEARTTLDALDAVKSLQDAALARIAEAGGAAK